MNGGIPGLSGGGGGMMPHHMAGGMRSMHPIHSMQPAGSMVPGVAQPGMGFKAQRMPKALPPALPQPTLYVRNLRETRNLTALRTALTTVFSKYGDIVEIKVKRNLAHRGQAFVSFKDVTSASKAKEEVHGFPLFNRPMDIQYAREQSFAVSALTGSVEEHKRKRKELIAEREAMEANDPSKKKRKTNTEDILPPNSILFIQSLPPDVSDEALSTLFKQFHGFKEVRLVPGRNDIAFVEYDNEMQSALAKQALHGHRMSPKDEEIKVTFAKK